MNIGIEPPTEIEALWEAEPDIGNGPEMSLRKIVRRHYMLSHGIAKAEERAETYLSVLAASVQPAFAQMTGWKNERCNGEPEAAETPDVLVSGALADIATERHRQVEAEGRSPAHDDEIARAADCYAKHQAWIEKTAADVARDSDFSPI